MTAHAIKGDREICLRAGMDAYLSKPVRADEMFQTIENLVAHREPAVSTASSSGARDAAFDESAFLSRMDGSHDVCVQIAEAFFVECPKLMSALRVALQRKDAVELAALAHGLKGTIANFTDGTAFQSAVKIEQLAREADLYRAADAFKRLETDVEALLKSLRSFASAIPKA
jgi:CheY-like chemotaxis protein